MTDGLAMGSPVSAVIANLYMETFEQRAIDSATVKPSLWLRYVDDVFSILKRYAVANMLDHLNKQNPHISFTVEKEHDQQLPFLDTTVYRWGEKLDQLCTDVYRKPTHTNRYLHFSSHHPRNAKTAVIATLLSRAHVIIQNNKRREEEIETIRNVLQDNGYPASFINQQYQRYQQGTRARTAEQPKMTVSIPYIEGTTQAIQRILRPLDIRVVGRPQPWRWSLQRGIKDTTPTAQQRNVVYKLNCKDCSLAYVGETCRALGTRVAEHLGHTRRYHPELSTVADHAISNDHNIDWENPEVLARSNRTISRRVKEAIWIAKTKDQGCMNKDQGLDISPLWKNLCM